MFAWPILIRRHGALVDIVYHVLSQSHTGTHKEDQSRPGDVYHPDFQHGHPAYLTYQYVVLPMQALYISSCSSCAWVAASAGELAKVQRHRDTVEEAGCDFIPLVVETFGVWSPFALKFINIIADRTTARSGSSISS